MSAILDLIWFKVYCNAEHNKDVITGLQHKDVPALLRQKLEHWTADWTTPKADNSGTFRGRRVEMWTDSS
jgi:hypothetical protein